MATDEKQGFELSFEPTIEYDPLTNSYAAWCDELDVATSGKTVEEAKEMLIDAIKMAAAFTIQHKDTLRWELLGQVPYAEMIHGKPDQEARALIDGHLQLRTDSTRS